MRIINPALNTITLLYSATRDGFDGNIFHSKVDGINKPTVTLYKNSNGDSIFGAYATKGWCSCATQK